MFLEYVNVSWLMMRSKPVRSILSLLGIYIGVLSLVVILSIREGVRRQLEDLYKTHGAKVIYVHPGFDPIARRIGHLSVDEIALLKAVPGVVGVEERVGSELDVRSGAATLHAHIVGIDEHFMDVYRVPVIRGRVFLKEEVDKKQALCLLSAEAALKLFPLTEPIGSSINMQDTPLKVIGVVNWNTEAAQRTSIQEADLFIPALWLAPKEGDFISTIEVRMRPEITNDQGVRLVTDSLSHGDLNREKLYVVRSLETFVEKSREFNDRILGGLLGIAAISLLVGGIGVANVMITSVTERTREVGIRKALGATRIHILSQFLIEASLLSGSGGLLAILTGALGVSVIPTFFALNIALAMPLFPCLGCFVLTLFIGLVAGVYPASRAALLSPAEALRYE